jgi:RimJ/RimL family protein N-acetyltransferase
MRPFTRQEVVKFRPAFENHTIVRWLDNRPAYTDEDEQEWYDKVRQDPKGVVWGIWADDNLIGNFSFDDIIEQPCRQATNGIIIGEKKYWGQGIASAVHCASLLYGFDQMNLVRIKSAVYQPNIGSWRAMEKCGFVKVYTERNQEFMDGEMVHLDHLECINPDKNAWKQWWHGEEVPVKNRIARDKTVETLEWARQNVDLP